jgi:hypothetical protein
MKLLSLGPVENDSHANIGYLCGEDRFFWDSLFHYWLLVWFWAKLVHNPEIGDSQETVDELINNAKIQEQNKAKFLR